MPVVICCACDYVGQGDTYDDRINDVIKHEKKCQSVKELEADGVL